MSCNSRRSFIALGLSAFGAAIFAGDAAAQVYYEDRPVRRRNRRRELEPDEGPYGVYCRPMCAEDMSPCDTPSQKAADGRCSSPTAGSLR